MRECLYFLRLFRTTGCLFWRHLPSWIMRTCMKQDNTSFRHFLKVVHHVGKVQVRICRVVVSVLANFETWICENGIVITPSGIWKINVLVPMLAHKFSKNTETTCSRKCLHTLDSIFFHGSQIITIPKLESKIYKLCITSLKKARLTRGIDEKPRSHLLNFVPCLLTIPAYSMSRFFVIMIRSASRTQGNT